MANNYHTLSEFNLEGKFLGFVGNSPQKSKYLRLALEKSDANAPLPSGDLQIQLPKELRISVGYSLVPGDKVRVAGTRKLNPDTGKLKLTAYRVTPISSGSNQKISEQPKTRILVCQKSGCMKRGGRRLLSSLEKALATRGLQDRVIIERTGCLKRCSKKGPNYVVVAAPEHNRLPENKDSIKSAEPKDSNKSAESKDNNKSQAKAIASLLQRELTYPILSD